MRAPCWLLLVPLAGCFKAGEVVIVDRATVLEQEAAGSYPELEHALARAEVAPRPVPLTPAQLEALGIEAPALVDHTNLTDADAADALLVERCIGEGNDGLLADTLPACRKPVDRDETDRLIERINRARRQLWRWMRSQRPGASLPDIRRAWQAIHAGGVVCGGWRQKADGSWEPKPC
ncbi:MAG TPA: DUF1318 domain-containing protein [Myxococcales bacterium]|nr:DUF1318 domain-containing protein [Myxococcales bacterium]